MSSAGTTSEQQAGKGTKRGPEEDQEKAENGPASGDQTGRPPTKAAKPNPSPAGDEDMSTPAAAGGGVAVAVAKAEGTGPTDSERVEVEALSSLGLAVGTRLEVMWLLEDDEKSVEKVSNQATAVVQFWRELV